MISSISNQTPVKELIKLRTREFIDATFEGEFEDLKPNKCSNPILFYIYFGSIDLEQATCVRDEPETRQSEETQPKLATLSLMASKMDESKDKRIVLVEDPVPGKLYWATVWISTENLNLSYKNADNVHGRYSESNMHDEETKEYSALYSVETGFVLFGSAERPLEGIMSSLTVDDVVSYKIGSVE
jgi:hypothetical protein